MDKRSSRRTATLFLAMLVAALAVLSTGAAASAEAPSVRQAEGDPRVVRVGTEGTYPPFTYKDPRTNQLTGYDIEVIEAVAKEAGWKLQFVQSTFDSIFPALDAKRVDVIANQVAINPEPRRAISSPSPTRTPAA